jgi:hypothetical protein
MIAANNGHLLAFDNLSGLPPWLSDALCRLASGGSFAVRQLYTDDEEVLFKAASFISSIEARRRLGLTMPRKTEADRFGKRTTLPSGCIKNLTRSPDFNPRCSRIAFGIVAWPFVVIADSNGSSHYILVNVTHLAHYVSSPRSQPSRVMRRHSARLAEPRERRRYHEENS